MDRAPKIAQYLLRLLFGGVLLAAGVLKGLQPDIFQKDILSYGIVGWEISFFAAYFLPAFEFVLGAGIFFKKGYQTALYLSIILLVGFTLLLTYTIIAGIDIGCGCFGDADPFDSAPLGILRDLVLLGIGGYLLYTERSTQQTATR